MTDDAGFYGYPLPSRADDPPAVAEMWNQVEDLYIGSGLDADPDSLRVLLVGDVWEVRVLSPSRGVVTIGSINYFPIARTFMSESEAALEPFRQGAQAGKRRTSDPKVARAKELRAAYSVARTAQIMLDEGLIVPKATTDEAARLESAKRRVRTLLAK